MYIGYWTLNKYYYYENNRLGHRSVLYVIIICNAIVFIDIDLHNDKNEQYIVNLIRS